MFESLPDISDSKIESTNKNESTHEIQNCYID